MRNGLIKMTTFSLLSALIIGCGGDSNGAGNGNGNGNGTQDHEEGTVPTTVTEAISGESSTLSQELKDSITYMYNEEKLAKDVYLDVYEVQKVQQLYNIATKSEVLHQEAVNELAKKYDLNITLYPETEAPYDISVEAYESGKYSVAHIQELYDMLYDKGIQSTQDALEVGCIVEVTDIDDLDTYIEQATASNASDVLEVFNFLRDGSYNHYWAFDKGLKNMGVSEGCCALGDEYCHPEYP
ncbi:MAG TPA: DUF2202 domain-containing protein [Campylobacterales bacterium]|nr:DUF2202 domain-containing protein [Campylobacterales bacterium]